MSDFSSKKYRELMGAYASIYEQKEQVVEQEFQQEDFEINEEALYESIVDYLVEFGYASDEKKAEAMIPHLGERFVDSIAGHIIICEQFVSCVNSLIEEGYDLSSSTWEELYEDYTGHLNTVLSEEYGDLSEQLAGEMPGFGLLRGLTGLLGGGAALSKVSKKPTPYRTRPEGSPVDYGQMTLEKPKPTTVVKSKSEDPWAGSATVPPRVTSTTLPTRRSATGGGGTGGGGNNEPPKGPNFFQRLMSGAKEQIAKNAAEKEAKKQASRVAAQQARSQGKDFASQLGRVGVSAAKKALTPGLGVLGAHIGTGGASSEIMRDILKFGRSMGPGYRSLKRDVKSLVEPEPSQPAQPTQSATDAEKEKRRIQNLFPKQGNP